MGQVLEEFYERLERCYERGSQEDVERYLKESAAEFDRTDAPESAAVYNELGSFYRGTSRYQQSISAFQTAGEQIVRRMGADCTEYATLLNNMAGTFRLMGEHEKAIGMFLEAIRIYRERGEERGYAYASVQNNLSLAYQEIGQYERAAAHLERALEMIRSMPGHLHDAAVTYSNLTALYHRAGRERDARRCLDRALNAFARCDDRENVHYAAALNSLAGYLYGSGEYERALETYDRAAAYTKRFFGENVEYAITHQNMAWAYLGKGDRQGAVRALSIAERVCESLFGEEHERTRTIREELARLTGEAAP